jgi:hypothetical protein
MQDFAQESLLTTATHSLTIAHGKLAQGKENLAQDGGPI